jgi:hypothetical protein
MVEKMPKTASNQPIVTVSIVRGKATPAQLRQFRAAFARLLARAQDGAEK